MLGCRPFYRNFLLCSDFFFWISRLFFFSLSGRESFCSFSFGISGFFDSTFFLVNFPLNSTFFCNNFILFPSSQIINCKNINCSAFICFDKTLSIQSSSILDPQFLGLLFTKNNSSEINKSFLDRNQCFFTSTNEWNINQACFRKNWKYRSDIFI